MKEYHSPLLTFIEFNERDVLTSSGSPYNPGWVDLDPYRQQEPTDPMA